MKAQVINGTDGSVGYHTTEVSTGSSLGTLWAICGPVGLFTLGLGWIVGIIGTPIVWVINNNKDKKARTESIAYTNLVPVGYIQPKDSISVMTLVPIGTKPQLKLMVCDERTKEYRNISY